MAMLADIVKTLKQACNTLSLMPKYCKNITGWELLLTTKQDAEMLTLIARNNI